MPGGLLFEGLTSCLQEVMKCRYQTLYVTLMERGTCDLGRRLSRKSGEHVGVTVPANQGHPATTVIPISNSDLPPKFRATCCPGPESVPCILVRTNRKWRFAWSVGITEAPVCSTGVWPVHQCCGRPRSSQPRVVFLKGTRIPSFELLH